MNPNPLTRGQLVCCFEGLGFAPPSEAEFLRHRPLFKPFFHRKQEYSRRSELTIAAKKLQCVSDEVPFAKQFSAVKPRF